ncbi:serotonin N-acetyltransferase 2, chloroplastic-like [Curcuma longa]|uniref:serotonin N-acetyltransferase 2, chloroplastic-like n=1 Tax=Curcuma longa TaxID=136217 RepID=UPI003D9DE0E5
MQSRGLLLPLRSPWSSPIPLRHRISFPTKPLCLAAASSFTVSDGELESQGFRVRRSLEGLDLAALNEVFARVGFPRRDSERLRRALGHATEVVVWIEELGGGKPVVFARALRDFEDQREVKETIPAWRAARRTADPA